MAVQQKHDAPGAMQEKDNEMDIYEINKSRVAVFS